MDQSKQIFQFFNEIGIINQLSTAVFNKSMPLGLHVSHFSVINHLVLRGDGVTPVKIADAFQITKATMTHTLSVLEKHGFIDVRANPKDGRSKLVYLTSKGTAFREEAIASLVPVIKKVADRIDLDAMLAALPILQDVRQMLDSERD